MNVRRVRLISEPPVHGEDCALRVPRARRARVLLDRMRVRSIWLSALEMPEVRTGWHGGGSSSEGGGRSAQNRSTPGRAAEPAPDAFLAGLREVLRPNVQAVLRREEWPERLYPFQEEGALFLYERKGALLADEQGLGKTVQALAAAGLLFSTGEIRQALILCPAPLVSHWAREAVRWLPRMEADVAVVRGSGMARHHLWHGASPLLICGYETFRADFAAGRMPDRPRDLVILDEAQRIKNAETELAHACKTLPRRRSWALTGLSRWRTA